MHLFGVLLPLFWLTRDRRFAVLIPVFAAGAIAMGSGTRIIIDSAVALFLWLVSAVNFRNRKATWGFIAGSSAIAAGGLLATYPRTAAQCAGDARSLGWRRLDVSQNIPYARADVVLEA
jgi:hypothetical protein